MAKLSRHYALSIEKTLFYLEQVCSGLAHAHKCGVIHRDIKPQNLLLSADRQIVKIADFGVARLEATEGAITRVGTNIYSAPEHNPLVQTGSLDLGAIAAGREHLTPAADIYSLAKTTYALLAGESPRRFAQHAIKELPAEVSQHYWSKPVLRVLEKATQIRPLDRYQTVQEFWDDMAEAALPPTKPLHAPGVEEVDEAHRRPSADLSVEPEEFTQAPPQPRFQPVSSAPTPGYPPGPATPYAEASATKRPKIVVPVSKIQTRSWEDVERGPSAAERIAALPDQARNGKVLDKRSGHQRRQVSSRRARPFVVAAALIVLFAGMLLATHKFVTSRWNPFVALPQMSEVFVIGREGVTTTDVNLRPDASSSKPAIGLAEAGSRVKVLATGDYWYEVQVLEHGRAKSDPFTSDRGWVNKRFVKFD